MIHLFRPDFLNNGWSCIEVESVLVLKVDSKVQRAENSYSYFVVTGFKVQSTVILIIGINKCENRTVRCTLKSVFLFFYRY